MVSRRDVLRAVSLAAMAIAAPNLLSACAGPGRDEKAGPSGDTKLTLVSSDVKRAAPDPARVATAVKSVHAMTAGLYSELAGAGSNLAISPYSVLVALAMAANGARGQTLDEMLGVLAAESADSLDRGLNALTQQVESLVGPVPNREGAEIALDSANALFGQQGVTWEKDFLDSLARWFGAGMRQVDYVQATEAARVLINQWTAEQTHDRIEEIIPEDVLDTLTRLVLVNTMYFKAPWQDPFEKGLTEDGPFSLEDGSTVTVPMMTGIKAAGLGSGDGWTSVRLPFAASTLAMTLVLPDEGRMGDLEAIVKGGRLSEVMPSTPTVEVDLTLPRWTFRSDSQLGDTLASLGMPTAFTERADFSGITTTEQIYISDVLHEVFIAVDEAGAEAAAATAVVFRATSAPIVEATVVFDRPFLFVIHDDEHGTPLFLGRLADPR